MSVSVGDRFGPYEILGPLGSGGMGEVYRAKDTRLDRIVAIKVLPPHLSSNPDFRQRFEREARTVSGLNHPHICTLHDIGHENGTDYLIMEFIEGETLASRLQKGPLTTSDVLRYSIQIADALDKAHKKGITHRDLKPGNIMLTKTGVKLLDFGLAKIAAAKPNSLKFHNCLRNIMSSLAKASFLVLCNTWRRNSWKGKRQMREPIFLLSVQYFMKWRQAKKRLKDPARRVSSHPY